MFQLLPWISGGIGGDKIAEPVKVLGVRPYNIPRVDQAKLPKLKRKRADSDVPKAMVKPASLAKRRAEQIEKHPQVLLSKHGDAAVEMSDSAPHQAAESHELPQRADIQCPTSKSNEATAICPSPTTTHHAEVAHSGRDTKALKQIIRTELNMAILLKHNELRLIDQEIAKTQIALEQLRRCHEIPYPTNTPSLDVTYGTGPYVRPPGRKRLPPSPAPWGVTNGPYTRHYAKWLLPDPNFDGGEMPLQAVSASPAAKNPTKGRSTRGSFTDTPTVGAKSRPVRGTSSNLQALSSGYPQPKGSSGPMIQKRKSDGLMVKLVCLDCRRSDFSSAQGFINHCRIAHNRSFASHDAAADACGEPVETDESGAVIGSDIPSVSTASLVHPLIRSAHLLKNQPASLTGTSLTNSPVANAPPSAPLPSPSPRSLKRKRGRKAESASETTISSFIPAPATPHLSSLLKARGSSLNLQDAVSDAQTLVDFDDSSEDESDVEAPSTPPANVHGGLTLRGGNASTHGHVGRLPRSTMSPIPLDRPSSRKGLEKPRGRKPNLFFPPSLPTPSPPQPYSEPNEERNSDPVEPSPTNDSNQAPSLVSDSDNDDYEVASVSESSSPGSSADSAADDDLDVEVEVEDYENEPAGPSRRPPAEEDEGRLKQHAPVRRASAFRRRTGSAPMEEKHVSFAGVSPRTEEPPLPKKGGRGRRAKGS